MFVCMKKFTKTAVMQRSLCALFAAAIAFSVGCNKHNEPKALKDFDQVNLVANNDEHSAAHVDATLLNAWGLAFSTGGTAWVNSTGGHVSEVYDKDGNLIAARPAVNIPSPGGATGGAPTGIVFNSTATDFLLSNGKSAAFIFVGADGIISAWNGPAGNNAILIANNVATSSYTGLTLAMSGGANYLYAANFKSGKIDVWDKTWNPVTWMPFKDNHIPNGFAPFNIQVVGSWLYVTYAKIGPDGRDQPGYGNGFVDIFNTDGSLVKRFAERGTLNSPWGIAQAPASFFEDMDQNDHKGSGNSGSGNGGNDNSGPGNNNDNGNGGGSGNGIGNGSNDESIILIGNFGDGHINAFRQNGNFIGLLKTHGHPVWIDGLWSLVFPPATATAIDPNRLYFTAGPEKASGGLFGYLIKH
jgi:uncharacterized protein (TIGR03118 family)